jgi:hypothetical protein
MTTKKIFLNISEIASFIGKNPYDSVTPFQRLWKRYDSEAYHSALSQLDTLIRSSELKIINIVEDKKVLSQELSEKKITKSQYNKKISEIEKTEIKVKNEIAELTEKVDSIRLTKAEQVEKALGKEALVKIQDAEIDTELKRDLTNKAIENLKISEENKQKLKQKTENVINTTHGTLKEDSAIDQFEKKFKVKLDTSQYYHTKEFKKTAKFEWVVGGKVDGLYLGNTRDESYVVEVKNRTKGFFNTLRDYEKCQIQLYIWMLNLNQAKLVEKYNNKIRITAIYRDQDFLDDIFECLEIFATQFEKVFLEDHELKVKFLGETDEGKKIILNKLYLSDITRYMNDKFESKIKNNDSDCLLDDLD